MTRKRYSAPDLFMSCNECGRLLVETPSGYLTCPKGHGKLKVAEPMVTVEYPVPLFEEACRHCGRDLAKDQVDAGAIYCGRCIGILDKHAALAGIGER